MAEAKRYVVVIPYREPEYKRTEHTYYARFQVNAKSPNDARDRALKEFKLLTDLSWVRWARQIVQESIRVTLCETDVRAVLSIDAEQIGSGVTVLTVRGVLDAATTRDFERRLNELARAGCRQLVLDLSELTYINSSGLGTLIHASRKLNMLLAAVQPEVRKVMDMIGLDRAFPLFETVEAAKAAIST